MKLQGLSSKQVEESRKQHGSNELTQIPADPLWKKILEGFKDPMIMILLVALVVQIGLFLLGQAEWFEPVGILIAIVIANGVASISENKQENKERIEEVLNLVGMSNKGYKLPNELSGGEQQRIVIARAVLNSPSIILADEPTGNLDTETGKSIVELLHNICSSGSSVVMTTHNLQLLKEYPGRVYRCANHQIVDVTDEYMPRQRTIEIDLNIDN